MFEFLFYLRLLGCSILFVTFCTSVTFMVAILLELLAEWTIQNS